MNPRMMVAGLVLASLVGSAAWLLLCDAGAGSSSVSVTVASEARASDAPSAEPAAACERPASFPVARADTPARVREVLRITREAGPADRPALRDAALHAADPLIAGNAALALGRLRGFSADADLLALVTGARGRVQQDAIAACGLDGGAAAIPTLQKALATGDAALRPLVLQALGRIGSPTARGLLLAVADDLTAPAIDRVFARSALERRL